jgi:ubiquinone/menaquinone biosynthesis C-methylase UbiE
MDWRSQFAKPSGPLGWMVGHVMAMKNGDRSEWVFSLLDLEPADRVLEIGFGPGADIERASRVAKFVAGVDHSELMVRLASKRNQNAIRDQRVELRHGIAARLPYPDAHFDCIFAINSAQFWKDSAKTLRELSRVLKPGGRVALAVQPRSKDATDETSRQVGYGLAKVMNTSGFEDVRCEFKEMKPVATACVLGKRSAQ